MTDSPTPQQRSKFAFFMPLLGMTSAFFVIYSLITSFLVVLIEIFFTEPAFELQVTFQILAYCISAGLTLIIMRLWFKKHRLRLMARDLTKRDILLVTKYFFLNWVVVISLIFIAVLLGMDPATGYTVDEKVIPEEGAESWLWLSFFLLVIVVPIIEEFIFRGFFFAELRRSFRFLPALLLSSFFFTILHLHPERTLGHNLLIFLSIASTSYFITLAFEKTRNLVSSIVLHGLHNATVLAVALLIN